MVSAKIGGNIKLRWKLSLQENDAKRHFTKKCLSRVNLQSQLMRLAKKTVSRSKINEEDREEMNDKAVGYLFESLEGDTFTKVSLKSTESAYQM